MGMERSDDDHVGLAREIDVVVESPFTPHQARVLEALDRLPDPELLHPKLLPIVGNARVGPACAWSMSGAGGF